MNQIFSKIITVCNLIRFIPHLIVLKTYDRRDVLEYEIKRWTSCNHFLSKGIWKDFLRLLIMFPEYRSFFYHRTGKNWLNIFAHGMSNLYFHTPQERLGRGLVLWHGYSTVINAREIGEDCEIWQNVTIGKKTTEEVDDKPLIGNNVKVCAGAICIGDIYVPDGTTIGAGAVLAKNITKTNQTVVGASVRLI